MRTFLSKILFTIFIAIFALPLDAVAQFNWTPPAGPPTGNNTPAPVNVGPFSQWREGLLKIGPEEPIVDSNGSTIFSTRGGVIFDSTEEPFSNNGQSPTSPQNQSFVSFLRNALFAGSGSFQVGETNGLGGSPRIFLNGQLRYVPRNANGSLMVNQQPSAGKVLRALDDSGLVGWGDATGLPQGGNDGDILIWDASTNTWITGPNSGGGMPPGSDEWQTLTWNPYLSSGPAWEANNNLKVNTSLNTVSTTDETASVQLVTMNDGNVLIDTGTLDVQVSQVRLPLQVTSECFPSCVDMTGKILTSVDSGGLLSWVDPEDLNIGGDGMPPGSQGQTLWYNNGEWVSTGQIRHDNFSTSGLPPFTPRTIIDNPIISLGAESSGNTRLNSPSVIFGSDSGGQNVRFNSSTVQFRGPLNNSPLTPGTGRLAFSRDDDGTFGWNKNLLYTSSNLGGIGVGQFRLRNPDPSDIPGASVAISTFVNEGLTILEDRTTVGGNLFVENTGDLFLEGIDLPLGIPEGRLKALCIDTETMKVIRCVGLDNDFGTAPEIITRNVTQTFTTNGGDLEFGVSGQVQIEYCGGGGGGGGGGIGTENNGNPAKGGGGGGGGGRGECQNFSTNVNAGQVLTWEIGSGGLGGRGAELINFNSGQSSYIASSAGASGFPTRIFIDGIQVGPFSEGGLGGGAGQDAYLASQGGGLAGGGGGLGANSDNNYNWWHDGVEGADSAVANCAYCGGKGGTGEHPGLTELVSGLGSRGSGGVFGNNSYGSHLQREGKNGFDGDASMGGGGGGGSFGEYTNYYISPTASIGIYYKAGAGGSGGGGYVRVTYPVQTTGPSLPTQIVFDSNGTLTQSQIELIPEEIDTVIIDVWGAGGGGGGAQTTTSTGVQNFGGGGGAGAHVRASVNRATLQPGTQVIVGVGGSAGISGQNPTNGGNGSQSSFGGQIVAGGGGGGSRGTTSQPFGSGGTGSNVASGGGIVNPGGNGSNGANSSSGSIGGLGNQGQNNGGNGAKTSIGNISQQSSSGSPGLIVISW